MDHALYSYIIAAFLGLLEGLTEFIPVSSTGHLLLASHFLGFHTPNQVFEVLIQLGAILAIITVYAGKLTHLIKTAPTNKHAQRFILGVLIAFIPAVILGLLLHGFIKSVLFASPILICWMLLIGGVILIAVDRINFTVTHKNAEHFSWRMCLVIGFCQCLAMIPGVSRSGATIVGALFCGADKRSAAEFSFFLALPTMMGAFALDLYKNFHLITPHDMGVIGVGFIAAFIAGLFVVKSLLAYVSRHGFTAFGIWRIVIGGGGLIALSVFS